MLPKKRINELMYSRWKCVLVCLFVVLFQVDFVCSTVNQTEEEEIDPAANRKLFVLVFDGLVPELTKSDSSKASLETLAATYPSPSGLSPVFPPLTLPSSISLLTGLQPHQHSFVDNFVYDSESKASFVYDESSASTVDFSKPWWNNINLIWTHLATTGGKNVSVYGSSFCQSVDNLECVREFQATNSSVEQVLRESVDKRTNVVFIFDKFIRQTQFETKSEHDGAIERAKVRVLRLCMHLKNLATELQLEDFNVIVTGNRAQTADNFYFINLNSDVLDKSTDSGIANYISFVPPVIKSQYFSIYSGKNASCTQLEMTSSKQKTPPRRVQIMEEKSWSIKIRAAIMTAIKKYLISQLEDIKTELEFYSVSELDKKFGSQLSKSRFPPTAVMIADEHFVISTQSKDPVFALFDGVGETKRHSSSAHTTLMAFGPEFIDEPISTPSASVTDVFALICDVMQVSLTPTAITGQSEASNDGSSAAIMLSTEYALSGMLKRNPQNSKPFHPVVIIVVASVICLVFASMVIFLIIRKHRIESQYTMPERNPPQIEMEDISA